jgi:fucose 4-O-acetylase-like acetyltransferase
MASTRLISIDIAKAICIILVVVGHYVPANSPYWYIILKDVIYTFHMPLFMFVSGYVYWATKKNIKYKDFAWKKFQRLMIPYFFTSVVIIVIKLLTERGLYVQNPVSMSAFYEMFYLPVAGYFLWFIYTLFLIFLIVPFFDTYKKLIILLVVSLISYFIPLDFPVILCLTQLKKMLFYFVLGCILYEWTSVRNFISRINFGVIVLIFTGLYVLKQVQASVCLSVVGIVLVSSISRFISQKTILMKNFLLNISVCSYTIYLFHTTFEGVAKSLLVRIPLKNYIGENLTFIVSAIIVITVGVIGTFFLHKIIVTHSKLFSYLIGARFTGKIKTNQKL